MNKLVVFRARSKGGTTGEPAHGVFLRDMAIGTPLATLFDRNTVVPQPNNITQGYGNGGGITFIEPPAFPRIDMWSNTVASRGGHPPVWEYQTGIDETTGEPITTRGGTTGIYTNPFGSLITGVDNLGMVPEFNFFRVPEVMDRELKFDVFPGAPAVTHDPAHSQESIIVFKGNYTVPDTTTPTGTLGKTGVYYRKLIDASLGASGLEPAGGYDPVTIIADSDTLIPGTKIKFGSTAPPSAVYPYMVFAGFDNEDAPTNGGIYLAKVDGNPWPEPLKALVRIGGPVPGQPGAVFNKLGEGLSFDGRFVAFWGAWGTDFKELILQCPNDGNKARVAYCKSLYGDGVNQGTVSSDGFHTSVPVHQGIFVHDIVSNKTWIVARSPEGFSDFVYWNFSGKVDAAQGGSGGEGTTILAGEGSGGGGDMDGGEEDGEPARWRSGSFVAVSGPTGGKAPTAEIRTTFKARTGEAVDGVYANPIDGIYLREGVDGPVHFTTLVATGMDGTLFDPAATYLPTDDAGNVIGPETPLPVTTMGIERDGFRGKTLVINVGMGNEASGWGGIYMMDVPK